MLSLCDGDNVFLSSGKVVTPQAWETWYQEVGDPRRHLQVRVSMTGPVVQGMCVAANATPNEQNISRAEDQ